MATTPRAIARLAPSGVGVRVHVGIERDGDTEVIRDVKAPDLWAALKELLVLQTLHERDGAQSVDLSVDPAVVNQALSTPAVEKLLAENHLRSVDVTFSDDGIVLGVVARLGPLNLPRRRYTIGIGAKRGAVEFDLAEILGIPIAGSKIAAIIDAKAEALDSISVRRRDNLLTISYPRLRCQRAEVEDDALHVTLSAAEPRASRSRPPA